MIKVGMDYSRKEWNEEILGEIHGIQRDICHDRFAPNIAHADFYIYVDKKEEWVYGVTMVNGRNIFEGKRIKVLGRLSKIEYDRL
jgi:hypothetical protein